MPSEWLPCCPHQGAHCRAASSLCGTPPGSENSSYGHNILLYVEPKSPPPIIHHLCNSERSSPSFIKWTFNMTNLFWANHPNAFLKSLLPQTFTECRQCLWFVVHPMPMTLVLLQVVGLSSYCPFKQHLPSSPPHPPLLNPEF